MNTIIPLDAWKLERFLLAMRAKSWGLQYKPPGVKGLICLGITCTLLAVITEASRASSININ
jgi:hypothetical protein